MSKKKKSAKKSSPSPGASGSQAPPSNSTLDSPISVAAPTETPLPSTDSSTCVASLPEDLRSLLSKQPIIININDVWKRAYDEGVQEGIKQSYRTNGIPRIVIDDPRFEAMCKLYAEEWQRCGIIAERNEWISAGHGDHCPSRSSSWPPHDTLLKLDASVQTSSEEPKEPPPLEPSIPPALKPSREIPPPPNTTAKLFKWAEEYGDEPIEPLPSEPPPLPPRDISVLRSSATDPFQSLRKRSRRRPRQSQPGSNITGSREHSRSHRRCRHRHSICQSHPSHTVSSLSSSHLHQHCSPSSTLDWDTDPRLRNLSWVLKDLGWVRTS